MKKFLLTIVLFIFSSATAQAVSLTLPLNKFTALNKLEMRCMQGTQSLSVPLSERWNVRRAVLSLRYISSGNLLGDISQMVVKINGAPIQQTQLIPLAPGININIPIPVQHMKSGYNTLSFDVVQHYLRGQCELFCAPDMWTNISLTESTLNIEYELKPLPLKLGEVAGLMFDPKQFSEATVNIITEQVTQDSVTLAAIVASGIARRFDYRKVKFEHSNKIMPGMDNVLIGSTEFAQRIAAPHGQPSVASETGALSVFHLPNAAGGVDKTHALLAITGEKSAALKVVAETLSSMTMPYPGTEAMRSHEFSMPDIAMYSGRQTITADKLYDFKTLNLPTTSFQGTNDNPIFLTFRLPADFLIKPNQYAKLLLNMSYGTGLRADSSINVLINDVHYRAIHLDNLSGSYLENYKLDIPTFLFKPGSNKISFSPSLDIHGRQLCDSTKETGKFATLFENSTLLFPPMPHYVELPKIELFALNGFPFSRWPDGFETMVYLPKPDNASITTALNTIGMITQKNGFPLFSMLVSFDKPSVWDGEMLVIGTTANIPKSIMAAAPMELSGIARVPYPISRGWGNEDKPAITMQQSGLGAGTGVLMEFESMLQAGRSIVLLAADSDADLRHLGEALLDPSVQAALNGGIALIDLTKPEYPVSTMIEGKKYTTGSGRKIPILDFLLHKYPYVFYGLAAFIVVMLGMLGFFALRRLRLQRMLGTGQAK